ncbi:hypothetical protein [Winogradskyella wichelsiae]|uniref:hypothetical protein n=1 Tax=Winogradskyella wichelsiae TaxID=2697007 RepID=UPI003EFA8D2D
MWIWIADKVLGIFTLGSMLVLLFASMSIFICFFRVVDSLGDYFVSDNLVNLKNIERIVSENYNLTSAEYIINYFNDSYIFLEHETVSAKEKELLLKAGKSIPTEILIIEFKSFFTEP